MRNALREVNIDNYSCCTTDDGHFFFANVLYDLESILLHMVRRNKCVFFTMLVLKVPPGKFLDDEFLIRGFVESLRDRVRVYKSDLEFLWVREHSATGPHRYYLILLLNGYRFRCASSILYEAKDRWHSWLEIWDEEGLVKLSPTCDNKYGGIKIWTEYKRFPEIYDECYRRMSYLAKFYCEGGIPDGTRRSDCSK